MRRRMILLLFLSFFVFFSCESPPPPLSPTEETYIFYTVEVKYIRKNIEDPTLLYTTPILYFTPQGTQPFPHNIEVVERMERIDDYTFKLTLPNVPDNENKKWLYCLWVADSARVKKNNEGKYIFSSRMVADDIIVEVKETHFSKKLENIQVNAHPLNPYPGSSARLALFRLKKDGTISDF